MSRGNTPLRGAADAAQALFWAWAASAGLLLFAAWWAQGQGVWRQLVAGDPSGISLGIVLLTLVCTGWCGRRAWVIAQQAQMPLPPGGWAQAYAADIGRDAPQAAQLLAERSHGPHETAWWFAGAAIKLGLLGTVVGFIVMSTQIARMPSFDIDQVQALLKQMTLGMAIALYTTLVGLGANLWLGLQLLLLDRMADRVVAHILALPPATVEAR